MQVYTYSEQSVQYRIKTLLQSPPNGFTNAFNVYGEDNFDNDSFVPTFPYVWLLGFRVSPRATRLPLIVVDMGNNRESQFEIGDRDGNLSLVNIAIFAKTRGQRDDLAFFLRQNMFNIPIYDFTRTSPVFQYNTQAIGVDVQRVTVSEKVGLEGALNNYVNVSFALQLLQ